MPFRIERTRYSPASLAFTWSFGLLAWGLVYFVVGGQLPSIGTFVTQNQLPAAIFLLLLVMCAFLRDASPRLTAQSSEDALILSVVLVYPHEGAVALTSVAAMLISIGQLTSQRLNEADNGRWYANSGEVIFQGGVMAFATLTGVKVYQTLYEGPGPLRNLDLEDFWRITAVFGAIYLIRLAILFLYAWVRGIPLVEYSRRLRTLRSVPVALTETATLLLGVSMAIVLGSGTGIPVFAALGGVMVAAVALLEQQERTRRQLESRIVELKILNSVGGTLADGTQARAELLSTLLAQGRALFVADSFALYLAPDSDLATPGRLPEEGQALVLEGVDALAERADGEDGEKAAVPLAEWCARNQRSLRIDDAGRELGYYGYGRLAEPIGYVSWLGAPLSVKGRLHGVVAVGSLTQGSFSEGHRELLRAFGQQVIAALDNARLFHLATVDALTGLFSARFLRQRLAEEFERARVSARPLSVVMVDIDFFKRVNDTYGHEVGNEVLKHVAGVVMARLRDKDTAARYGGEEFTVLLPGAPPHVALEIAERLRAAIESAPVETTAGPVPVTASLGVSSYPAVAVPDHNALLAAADAALYESKRGGRNRVTEAPSQSAGETPDLQRAQDTAG